MAEAVYAELLGVSREEAAERISFSKTTESYYKLIDGQADILIVYEGNEEVEEYRTSKGFEWEKTEFAKDAFVFVVNEKNPVNSITIDEARRIYTGEITNWAQLGGDDMEITAFQRNPGAGSQTLMEKLVMQGEPMMEAPSVQVIRGMGELIEAVKGYDNSPGAIGYSVFYYAEEMRMAQGLKLLAVEGVEPTNASIHSGEYPLINPLYVVISAEEAGESPARILYDWILSEPGQQLAAREGYVPVMDFETAARELAPLVGGRWYEDYKAALIPSRDYGDLVPYLGQRLGSGVICLYGLMTRDGLVVTDPVYTNVRGYYGKILSLCQVEDGEERYYIAAMDGSWSLDTPYLAVRYSTQGLTLFSQDSISLVTPEGGMPAVLTRNQLGVSREDFEQMIEDTLHYGGWAGEWREHYIALLQGFYDLESGKTVEFSHDEWLDMDRVDITFPKPVIEGAWQIYDSLYWDDYTPYLLELTVPGSEAGSYDYTYYYYTDGTLIPALTHVNADWSESVSVVGGLIQVTDADIVSYYDLDTLDCVFRTYLNYVGD